MALWQGKRGVFELDGGDATPHRADCSLQKTYRLITSTDPKRCKPIRAAGSLRSAGRPDEKSPG